MLRPTELHGLGLRGLDLPGAAARPPDRRDGPRRRRGDVGRAGRAPVPARVRRRPLAELGDSAVRRRWAAPGWRSPPTPSWCGRCSSPAASSATWRSTARSTTWRCRGAHAAVPVDRVHPGGGHRAGRHRPGRRGAGRGRARRRGPAGHRRHQGGRQPATATASTSTPPGIGVVAGRRRHPPAAGPRAGDVVIVSGDIGVHGVAVMSVPRGPGVRHRRSRATRAPLHGLVAAMLATGAGRARAARPHPRRGGGVAERDRQGRRRRRSSWSSATCPIPADGRATPAPCSGWTRCTSPTRASCWRSCPRERRRRGAGRDARPSARRAERGVIGDAASTSTRAWWWPGPALGGTRVVDLPIGEQLPRIC